MTGSTEPRRVAPSYEGRILSRENCGEFQISIASFEAGLRIPPHIHESACLSLVLTGRFLEKHQREYSADRGTILVKPPGEAHSCLIGETGSRLVFLEYDYSTLETLLPAHPFDDFLCQRSEKASMLGLRIEQEMALGDDFSMLALHGLSLEIVASVARAHDRPSKSPPLWLARVRELLHERVFEAPTGKELAAEAGVHPSTLSRAFRAHYGVCMAEYARQIRLEWVSRQLVESNRSLAMIAQAAGFTDQSHLTRWFRRFSGMPPGEFRRRSRS